MTPRFGLEVSPALIAFSELLMLPYSEMQKVVEDELHDNVALERSEPRDCPVCRGVRSIRCPVCCADQPSRGPGSHPLGEVGDLALKEPDTHALLRVVLLETVARDAPIVEYLIDSLDEHGLLDRSPTQLAADLGVDQETVERLIEAIRRAGPPGVGATSVSECLLLQLDALDAHDPTAKLARLVIRDHLPALAKRRFPAIAATLGCSRADVEQVLDLIRKRLRPYPAFDGNRAPVARYVVPDVVVREHGELPGVFTVELVEPALTRLRVRPGLPSASQARSFLGRPRDRWDTLRRVAEYTVERQRGYLAAGAAALQPLTRAEVATALDLHESTVSRALADKYVLLPTGAIVPISVFFGVSGGLDGALRSLLESADGPMSDQRLADRLCHLGYPIARRTVAKHRARLGYTVAPLR